MRLAATAIVLLAANLALADESRVVAVVGLDTTNAKLSDAAKVKLEESIRAIAGDLLTPLGYTVLTAENTIAIIRENGGDLKQGCNMTCIPSLGCDATTWRYGPNKAQPALFTSRTVLENKAG